MSEIPFTPAAIKNPVKNEREIRKEFLLNLFLIFIGMITGIIMSELINNHIKEKIVEEKKKMEELSITSYRDFISYTYDHPSLKCVAYYTFTNTGYTFSKFECEDKK